MLVTWLSVRKCRDFNNSINDNINNNIKGW